MSADPRLILREDELDLGLELLLVAEAALWIEVDAALETAAPGLGRSHWRALFLIPRRPGLGVLDLAPPSRPSQQSPSKTLGGLQPARLADKVKGDLHAPRPGAALTG